MANGTSFVLEEEQRARLRRLMVRSGSRLQSVVLRQALTVGLRAMEDAQDDLERLQAAHAAVAARTLPRDG
jgi:predicted DNA-binding protein